MYESLHVAGTESGHLLEVEAGEGLAEIVPLSENRPPGEPRLESLQGQLLEEASVVGHGESPLPIVIVGVGLVVLHRRPGSEVWRRFETALFVQQDVEAGDRVEAADLFGAVTEAGAQRVTNPFEYVRSFYFLGKIHENRGEMESAREYYRRFYEYWKDGDMDRERVEEARSKLETM